MGHHSKTGIGVLLLAGVAGVGWACSDRAADESRATTTWEEGKRDVREGAEKMGQAAGEAWEDTKQESAEAWDETKQTGAEAWDKTKEQAQAAADEAGETYQETEEQAKEKWRDATE